MNLYGVDPQLLDRVRDRVASGDPEVLAMLQLLMQYGEHLKETILSVPSESVDGYKGAVVQIRLFGQLVKPPVQPEQARGNSYIPE